MQNYTRGYGGKLVRLSPLRLKRTFPAWTRAYRQVLHRRCLQACPGVVLEKGCLPDIE